MTKSTSKTVLGNAFNNNYNNTFEKISNEQNNNRQDDVNKSTLEGVVKLLLSDEQNTQLLQRMQFQFNSYQQTISRQQSMLSDLIVMVTNLHNTVNDLKRSNDELCNKISNLETNVKNIRIYKTVTSQ